MARHPFDFCATKYCCFCWCLDSDVLCCIIAVFCIVLNGFSGLTNFGVLHWALCLFSLFNLLLHLLAGTLLLLGGLWGRRSLKLAYCWLVFFGLFSVVVAFILFALLHKHLYILWSCECHEFDDATGIVIVSAHTAWLVLFDLYTSMVVLGNLSGEEDRCGVVGGEQGV